jgi:hypothetical protein
MNKAFLTAIIIFVTVIAAGQSKETKWKQHQKMTNNSVTCLTCHTNDRPTKEAPGLVKCPRRKMMMPGFHKVEEGPEYLVLDEISNKFGPVIFDHRTHAHMAEMKDGCYGCHHYNEAKPIQPCKECHSTSRVRTDLSKPDLKGARHRQCIDCHYQWSGSVECSSCHSPKDARSSIKANTDLKSLKKKIYPKVEIPSKMIYQTKNENGKIVTFFHDEHANKFGFKCVDCHQDQNCGKCHDQKKKAKPGAPLQINERRSMNDLHRPCFTCHSNDKCGVCHSDKPKAAFDHAASAGWPLGKFHVKLSCQKCHGNGNKFKKLDNNCVACHKNWNMKTFNHKKTGLALDETHSGFDCGDCHIDKNFGKKPSCKNCHDDKSYPANKPGKTI